MWHRDRRGVWRQRPFVRTYQVWLTLDNHWRARLFEGSAHEKGLLKDSLPPDIREYEEVEAAGRKEAILQVQYRRINRTN